MKTLLFAAVCCSLLTSSVLAQPKGEAGQERVKSLLAALDDSTSNQVLVAAHRAGWRVAPENSLSGMAKCIEMGADVIETDVRRTKDGQYVIIHDKTLDRTTTGTGRVEQFTLAELRQLRLKDADGKSTDERLPTLPDVVTLTRGKILVYWDKAEDEIDQLHAQLKALDGTDNALFYGRRTAAELRARYGSLADQIHYLPKVSDATDNLNAYIADLAAMRQGGAFVIEFKTDDSTVLQSIQAMKAGHKRVWASPLLPDMCGGRTDELALTDPEANWGWMIARGVNMFCTDRPQELLRYLRAKGLHS